MLLIPQVNFIPATMVPFESIWWWPGWLKKNVDWYPWLGHPVYFIMKVLHCWSHPSVSIHIGHKYLYDFSYLEGNVHLLLPQLSLPSIFQHYCFKVPYHLAKLLVKAQESLYNHIPGHLSLQANKLSGIQFLSIGKIFHHTVCQGSHRAGVVLE